MPAKQIPEPWRSFLSEVELHCFGGFVVTMLYGLARITADVDVITIAPGSARSLCLFWRERDLNFIESMGFIWTLSLLLRFLKITTSD
jgi:hypothetical protein